MILAAAERGHHTDGCRCGAVCHAPAAAMAATIRAAARSACHHPRAWYSARAVSASRLVAAPMPLRVPSPWRVRLAIWAPAVRPGQLAPAAAPPGERAWTEPAADLAGPSPGVCGPIGQACDPQPGPHVGGIGELSQPGGPSQRGQHCQARCERGHHRGGHRLGPQPQQAQAQAHQRQHRHAGTATRRRDAAPARFATGSPSGGAHCARDQACPILDSLPCLTLARAGVLVARWAKLCPEELAAAAPWAGPARSARRPLPPPAAVHPATRTATAPSSAPARRDRARTCEVVIAPSRHGSGGIHLTHRSRDRFHRRSRASTAPAVLCRMT
jgi:hypothetical protein